MGRVYGGVYWIGLQVKFRVECTSQVYRQILLFMFTSLDYDSSLSVEITC